MRPAEDVAQLYLRSGYRGELRIWLHHVSEETRRNLLRFLSQAELKVIFKTHAEVRPGVEYIHLPQTYIWDREFLATFLEKTLKMDVLEDIDCVPSSFDNICM